MSRSPLRYFLTALALLAALPLGAESRRLATGSDNFVSGQGVIVSSESPGDLFVAGGTVIVSAATRGDAHAVGFDVGIEAPVAGDLYAAGGSVTVHAPVSEDMTTAAASLRLAGTASVGGNARLAGAVVILDGPVGGSLTASGAELTLNDTVGGDARLSAETLTFGPDARILGRLTYAAPEPLEIPVSVIAPDRVTYERLDIPAFVTDAHERWRTGAMPSVPLVRVALLTTVLSILFLLAVAAIFLAFAPELSERLRRSVADRPGSAFLAGLGGLAALFGLVPVAVLTIIGVPMVPLVVLAFLAAWMAGYLLAAHFIAQHLLDATRGDHPHGLATRLLALAGVLVMMALLNFVPLLGWFVNFTLVLLGIGGFTLAVARPLPPDVPR